jgi:transglutaminase-like putative cysteine protease
MLTDHEKWMFLRDIPQTDKWHRRIRDLAGHLYRASEGNPRRFALLAHAVARDWIHQETDTKRVGHEDIAGLTRNPTADDAVDALDRGVDDCDAKARLFVAICLAGGLNAHLVPYWLSDGKQSHAETGRAGEQLFHVAAACFVDGQWLPVELTLSRARLGEPGEKVPVEPGSRKWKEA